MGSDRVFFAAAAAVTAALLLASPALAVWTPNGVPVCVASNDQINPAIATDGAGGAFVVWRDKRSAPASIYAQRLDADGNPLWAANGVLVTPGVEPGNAVLRPPLAVSDGVGGAYIVWDDVPTAGETQHDVYAQRIRNDGVLMWSAPVGVLSSTDDDIAAAAISDFRSVTTQARGVIVAVIAWGHNLRLQHLDQNGTRLWGTAGSGPLGPGAYVSRMSMSSDATNTLSLTAGAIVSWDAGNIYGNRVDRGGVVQWGASGVVVCDADSSQFDASIATVGARSVIISWTDLRGPDFDVYAQKVADGVPSWTPNGVPVSTAIQHQVSSHTATAGDGAFVVWLDQRVPPHTDVYAQRLDLNGNPQWAADGIPLESDASGIIDVVPDGASGFLMAWTAGNELRAQRVDHDGNRLWQPDGVPVRTGAGFTIATRMMWNGAALILAWADHRSGTNYDLYAGQVPASGITGVPLSERLSTGLPVRLLSSNPHVRGDVRLAVDLSEAAPLAVDVFDSRGRLVWRLPSEERRAGAHVLRWNGRDPSGARPPAGVYFLRATAGARSGTVKLLLLR